MSKILSCRVIINAKFVYLVIMIALKITVQIFKTMELNGADLCLILLTNIVQILCGTQEFGLDKNHNMISCIRTRKTL